MTVLQLEKVSSALTVRLRAVVIVLLLGFWRAFHRTICAACGLKATGFAGRRAESVSVSVYQQNRP